MFSFISSLNYLMGLSLRLASLLRQMKCQIEITRRKKRVVMDLECIDKRAARDYACQFALVHHRD